MNLDNKVYILTGAGHGIGKATALELSNHGATVVVNDLGSTESGEGADEEPAQEVASSIKEDGGQAMAHFGDVTDVEYTESLVEDTVEEYGRVDGVANFAGILRDNFIQNMSPEDWDTVVEVHLRGHYSIVHNIASHWIDVAGEQGGSLDEERTVLTVASEAVYGNMGQSNYSAAKAGILGLTRAVAREFDQYNIRINSILPRAHTRLIETMPDHMIPDLPDPEELTPLNVFLLSHASTDISGCTFLNTGDTIGLVSDPDVYRSVVNENGWTTDGLADAFWDSLGQGDDLMKTDLPPEVEEQLE
jgi:NAD(P)-dependent dehydrogenase (short-subunit alcohol dehydrogenase family)